MQELLHIEVGILDRLGQAMGGKDGLGLVTHGEEGSGGVGTRGVESAMQRMARAGQTEAGRKVRTMNGFIAD